jgi:hypothetical protein
MKNIVLAAAAILVGGVVMLSAQSPGGDGISRELVIEVRALRGVIERYAESQIQTQALTSLMDVQQRRLADVNTRLDAVRKELDAASLRMQDVSRRLTDSEQATPEDLRHAPPTATPAERRAMLEEMRGVIRHEFEALSAQVDQIRVRDSELRNQLAAEEGKWNELVGRLDQWLSASRSTR